MQLAGVLLMWTKRNTILLVNFCSCREEVEDDFEDFLEEVRNRSIAFRNQYASKDTGLPGEYSKFHVITSDAEAAAFPIASKIILRIVLCLKEEVRR